MPAFASGFFWCFGIFFLDPERRFKLYPVLFKFHSLTVYSYGFFVAMGMLMAFYMAVSRAPRWGLSKDIAADLVFLLFITGVIGARLFYVWQHFEEYGSNPLKVFSIQEGGLVWYGGFVCAVAGGFAYAVVKKIPIERGLDFFAPLIPLAHAIGRLGWFL